MILDILIAAALVIGSVFTLVGSYGLVKLDRCMARLHAPTKASTLGVGALLIASVLHFFATEDGSLHEILILAFLFVTAPLTAHFLAKSHIHWNTEEGRLPDPPEGETWAVQAPAESPLEDGDSTKRLI
ncbi:Na+/H+ antiporter subunit G [Tranquillimonas alkanivorans]|uniref:Multisubunit potassium/proton antiporter, PhaG subunit n=1 Tax=Tranquillimonas alkanivorans TaxID=441119 RepID=A0A1I5Q8R1_9RHOB|nr:Na+/H+ antiporter subunit G [Tranquillimonas alkanivorans]SFP42440.1 multisubunit potassium/proton antiporter, PhaG subunit [Tranquillimonas alkanivorans]